MSSSVSLDVEHLESAIERELDRILSGSAALTGLLKSLTRAGQVVIFGGFVRDRIHEHIHLQKSPSRDLDLVVNGTLTESLAKGSKNKFQGRRQWLDPDLKVDYWELNRTYAFCRGLFDPKVSNLPLTTVYTVNACMFDLSDHHLVEHQALQDITHKLIAFNCEGYLDVYPEYQAFRAIELAHRLRYRLHPRVRDFVRGKIGEGQMTTFARSVMEHRPDLAEATIENLCQPYR